MASGLVTLILHGPIGVDHPLRFRIDVRDRNQQIVGHRRDEQRGRDGGGPGHVHAAGTP